VYVCVCVCVWICVCACVQIRVCACVHIHTHVCVYTFIMHIRIYLCTHSCRFVGSKHYPAAFYHCTSLAQLADLVLNFANVLLMCC
jgi:hypothetical protein